MNFGEALKGLNEGKKIKVPEWKGFWFKQSGMIKVFTTEGEVLDTPHFQQYIFRNDWQFLDDEQVIKIDYNKTTLHKLEEKINYTFPTTSETIGTERERIVVEILDLLREEYDNERDMVIKFAMGITPRMNHDDIVKCFDNKYRS